MPNKLPTYPPNHPLNPYYVRPPDVDRREPIVLPEVSPDEVWEDVPASRKLKDYEAIDLKNRLIFKGIPARYRDTKRGVVFLHLFTGKVHMVPQVPQRFLPEATRIAEEFLREEDNITRQKAQKK